MFKSTAFLFFVVFGSFQATVAHPGGAVYPQVNLTVNATSISVGSPVKLTCSVAHYSPSTAFDINFYEPTQDGRNYFAYYFINQLGKVTFENQANIPDLTRHPVSSTFPDYEITVVAGNAGERNFTCQLLSYVWSITSGSVSVKVTT